MQYNHKIKSLLFTNSELFTTGSSTISLQNNIIGERNTNEEGSTTDVYGQKLLANPITISNGVTKVKVQHRDHGMYLPVTML